MISCAFAGEYVNFRLRAGALRTCVYTRGMNRNLSVCLRRVAVFTLLPLLAVPPSFGWGDTGHKMINRLGVESLPSDVPAFLRAPGAIDETSILGRSLIAGGHWASRS